MTPDEHPQVHVVICAHNEAAMLPALLESLRDQTVRESFAVTIVDNASTDETRSILDLHRHTIPFRYIFQPKLGLNLARNSGAQSLDSEYVAFIDADSQAHSGWIETILRVIDEEQPDLLGGPYFPHYVEAPPPWYRDEYCQLSLGDQARPIGNGEFVSGPNMIWRRAVLEQLGWFATDIGLQGRGFARGDETELMIRARREIADFRAFYDPSIIVYHTVRPLTYSIAYWLRRSYTEGRSHHLVWGRENEGLARSAARLLRLMGLLLMEPGAAYVWRDRSAFPHSQNYLFAHTLPLVHSVGRAISALRRLGR